MMNLREAKSSLYDEVASFAKHSSNHSYQEFMLHSDERPGELEYSKIYWTLIFTGEIKEGEDAPPKKSQIDIISYIEQRVGQLERKVKTKDTSSRSEIRLIRKAPHVNKTGMYDKYRTEDEAPQDLVDSLNDDGIEISDGEMTAKDIFHEMNMYVASVMQKKSTKNHLIISGAPG